MKITGATIYNNGIGIVAPPNSGLEIDGLEMWGNGVAIQIQTEGITPELARELVQAVSAGQDEQQVRTTFGDRLRACGLDLDQLLARGANLSTIAAYLTDKVLGGAGG